jgi:Uma2 family endonuclease
VGASARVGIEELHRYSLDAYHRLIEAGGFDEDERVELLDGLLVAMSPKTPRHERAVRRLGRWLTSSIDEERYEVGIASPLTLETSEPEPDVALLVRGAPSPYHPATAALVIEVAVSSLARDLGVKAELYAAAGIPEYWVLDLDGGRMLVHRRPTAGGYDERSEVGPGEVLSAERGDLPPIALDDVLRAARA